MTINLGDKVASLLRTAVPAAWGAIVTLLLGVTTKLPQEVADWLNSPLAISAVTSVVMVLWYALWRRLEPRIPDWLTTLVLGYAMAPTYQPVAVTGAPNIVAYQDADGVFRAGEAAAGETGHPLEGTYTLNQISRPES